MLAEKYMLLLETIRSLAERGPAYADGAPEGDQHLAARARAIAGREPEVEAT